MNDFKLIVAALLAACIFLGCTETPPAESPETNDEPPATIPAEPATPADLETPTESTVTLERPRLPGDVFFDEPLSIAANRTRIPGAVASSEALEMTGPPEPMPESAAPSGSDSSEQVDWASVLPAELLVAEVQRIRERFEPKLSSVATFNSSLLDFPPYAAELAALAGIATEHSGNIPWKDNAKHVRDLASEMTSGQLQRGQKFYEQVNGPFEKVKALLDGNRPDGLAEADDVTDFAMTVDFGYLMQRFEAGQNLMRTIGGSEQVFQQNAADLAREARVIAALSRVCADDDFGYGDDPEFQGYATTMTDSALAAAQAAETGDFSTFDTSINTLGQSCVQCHGVYRN